MAEPYECLGIIYLFFENYSKSLKYLKASINIISKIMGEMHPELINLYSIMIIPYIKLGDVPNVELCYSSSMKIAKIIYNNDKKEFAELCSSFGHIHRHLMHIEIVVKYYTEAKKFIEKNHEGYNLMFSNIYEIGRAHV